MYIIQLLICINLSMFPLVQSPLWNFGLTSVWQKQVPLCINLDKSLKHNVYQIVPEDYFASIIQECKYHAHSVVFVVSTRTEHLLLSLWLTCLIIHQLCFIPQTEYMRQTECTPWKKSFICLQEGTSDGCLCLTQILGFQQCTSLQCRHTFHVELIPVNMWTMPYTHQDHHF
jgi:hypothetical protein